VEGTEVTNGVASYTIDNAENTFEQTTYAFSANQEGARVNFSGDVTTLARGLESFGLTYTALSTPGCSGDFCPANYNPPETGSWAVLSGQSGGLVQLLNQAVTPVVAAVACPTSTTAQSYQFVTIPAPTAQTLLSGAAGTIWYPQFDTAYGTLDVSASGTTVNFSNIKQYTIGSSTPLKSYVTLPNTPAAYTSISGTCYPTFYGNTISVPGTVSITNPGNDQTVAPSAVTAIGPTGLLVESNSAVTGSTGSSVSPSYQPFMGAGTGAIGLPTPSAAISTSALTGAQYLGFVYSSGTHGSSSSVWSSTVASFGFAATPSTCGSIAPAGATVIYGGDFPANNPGSTAVQAAGGYGNCDLAIDLGPQSGNGLFPNATVYIGPTFSANTVSKPISFPAVAIAGQLNGKYAIFLIGSQNTFSQPGWGIYLLQSS
jgi:hypothetical protein